jgi:threonine synthase
MSKYKREPEGFRCSKCGDLLEFESPDLPSVEKIFEKKGHGIWRFFNVLPVEEKNSVSLEEGNTPLLKAKNTETKGCELFFKLESLNPTGSFKDRGMTVAISHAYSRNERITICASTGNTSSSLAAYAARAGIISAVIVPEKSVSPAKLFQASMLGARIYTVKGNFDQALKKAGELASKYGAYLVNSINPYRIEGQKTVSFELYEQLGMVMPDYVFLPVGNAGNISAVFKGFSELSSMGAEGRVPKLVGVQAEGANPLAMMLSTKSKKLLPIRKPRTIASAIRIGNPVSWKKAIKAVEQSSGTIIEVSDKDIIKAKKHLAEREGILAESASAASLAGFMKFSEKIKRGSRVVCIITGNGLKEITDYSNIDLKDVSELEKLLKK